MDSYTVSWRTRERFLLGLLPCLYWGCAPAAPPLGVIRLDPENPPSAVAGPMPHFGPYASELDALVAACPVLLSQPRATAGRRGDMNFDARWKASTEYCAWLYYTPDNQFEMSMLVESAESRSPDEQNEKGCRMPAFVEDKRYPSRSLQHVYVLHNHPAVPTHLSEKDIRAVVNVARIHGEFIETKSGRIPVGVVAFYSNAYAAEPGRCDGFFEYSLGRETVLKWTPDERGRWSSRNAGSVRWVNKTQFVFVPE